MIETCDAKKQLSTAKPLVKGFNFFKSGHVLSILFCLFLFSGYSKETFELCWWVNIKHRIIYDQHS